MKESKRILAGILVASLLISTPAFALSEQELRNKKSQQEQRINEQDETIQGFEIQVDEMNQELQKLDQEIYEYSEGIDALDTQIQTMKGKIKESQRELKDINKNIKKKKESFEERLQAVYVTGKTSYIELLLSSSNISDLLSKTHLVQNLVEHDTDLIESLEEYQKDVEERKADLHEQEESLSVLQKELEKQREELEAKAQEKEDLIEEIQSNLEYAIQVREQMKAEQEAIDAQIRAAAEQREQEMAAQGMDVSHIPVESVGQMAWPVPASYNVSSEFGNRNSPFAALGDFHTGLDISAPFGTPIIAARAGTVVYAGWGGYGVTVIIDHGGGLYTLYGHGTDGSITVSNGQQVVAGDVIMGVGSTGYSTGPHLHFEVRVGGNFMNNAVNPRQFL